MAVVAGAQFMCVLQFPIHLNGPLLRQCSEWVVPILKISHLSRALLHKYAIKEEFMIDVGGEAVH